jgi:hypothetical protein
VTVRNAAALLALALAACVPALASEDVEEPAPAAAPRSSEPVGAERQALLRAKLATALSQLAPLKMICLEHYMTNGAWPAAPADVGLDAAELRSSVIASVAFEPDGTVLARLSDDFGYGAAVRITPRSVMGGTSFEWRCSASVAPAILRTLPCEAER